MPGVQGDDISLLCLHGRRAGSVGRLLAATDRQHGPRAVKAALGLERQVMNPSTRRHKWERSSKTNTTRDGAKRVEYRFSGFRPRPPLFFLLPLPHCRRLGAEWRRTRLLHLGVALVEIHSVCHVGLTVGGVT